MGSAVATPRRRRSKPPRVRGWWGDGPPPTERWPGVTIEFPAVWQAKRHRWESPDGAYFYDQAEADRAVTFFPTYLRHHIGEFAGEPFHLLDYQRLLLTQPLFGWKRSSDGLRRIRKVFAFIPKGGGKSPWGAGTGLYLAFCDNEPGANVAAVAADKKQARTVHDNARIMVATMIEIEPEFRDLFVVKRDAIECPETHSVYEVVSADADTKHGVRPHGVIYDEMHAAQNRALYEAYKKSMVKRRQPVMVIITHAGEDDEGICYEEYEYASAVLRGTIDDDTCLPVIFEAAPDDDWTSPVVWKRVNPGHGITVKHDGVAQECREALNEPRKRNDFLRYTLNRWVNQASAWIPVEWWDACDEPMPSDDELRALPCAAGLDLAQKWDLACFSVVFRRRLKTAHQVQVVAEDESTGETVERTLELNYSLIVLPFFWVPRDTMQQHEREDGVPYSEWTREKLVTATDGPAIDYSRIFHDITKVILPRFPRLKKGGVGYDPAFASDIAQKLQPHMAKDRVLEIPQNYRYMSEPGYIFEALIKAKRVVHGGHRVLRNHLLNVEIKTDDAKRIRPVKPKRASKHIDGVVATLMGECLLATVPDTPASPVAFVV